MIRLFLRRVLKNKIYWLAVFSALILLLCSVIYTEPATGEAFTFLSLFYHADMQKYLQYGMLSLKDIWMGYQLQNYLGMFTPIIVGIPCVLNQRTERFVLFRGSKTSYFLSKYIANIVLGGGILVLAQALFVLIGLGLVQWFGIVEQTPIAFETFLDIFCDGVLHAIPGIALAEIIRNKYLILCLPFVWNYFIDMFLIGWIPFEFQKYMLPEQNPIVFAGILLVCGLFIKAVAERRCDCGQK